MAQTKLAIDFLIWNHFKVDPRIGSLALRSKAMEITRQESLSPKNSNLKAQSSASYYVMKSGFILRLEEELNAKNIPLMVKANLIDPKEIASLNQDQANYRVAIFRDEILEMDEYQERVFGLCN
jgi:hypothetical protein